MNDRTRLRALARNLLNIRQREQQQSAWQQTRQAGKAVRRSYTDTLQAQGTDADEGYRAWTNTVYQGLFGKDADQMREAWAAQQKPESIARNHIADGEGLSLVAAVERRVASSGNTDLSEAHRQAISQVKQERIIKRMLQQFQQ